MLPPPVSWYQVEEGVQIEKWIMIKSASEANKEALTAFAKLGEQTRILALKNLLDLRILA